ncbi:hypothetical protein CRENBAI_023366 [Crenichthys baileyi]|uniref:BESS domain-containing protein n=1 Tax=Crenichthys baileyi TaxID=28760 RepID=A0AAV9S2V5_9TELE
MSFLLPYVQPSSSKNSLCPTGGLKGERTGIPLSLADTEERAIMPSSSYSTPPTSGEKRSRSPTETPSRRPATKAKSTGTPMEDRIMCLLENLTPTNTHKESSHFALSTVPILTKLSSPRRRRAKREIMRILDDLTDEQEEQQKATAST